MNFERDFHDFNLIEQIDPDEEIMEHLKWVCDGAETLSGAAKELREFADYLVSLEEANCQLATPVTDGHFYILNYAVNN